jgi:hypothetical protein
VLFPAGCFGGLAFGAGIDLERVDQAVAEIADGGGGAEIHLAAADLVKGLLQERGHVGGRL